ACISRRDQTERDRRRRRGWRPRHAYRCERRQHRGSARSGVRRRGARELRGQVLWFGHRAAGGGGRLTTSKVAIVMGSTSDQTTMRYAAEVLESLGVESETRVLSAHRTPEALREWVDSLEGRGVRVVICGAGGAAHLAGAVAALTTLPVIGVPLVAPNAIAGGLDALLSTVQMPRGVPVATVAVGEPGAANAGILAAEILAISDQAVAGRLRAMRGDMAAKVLAR